MRYYSLVFIVLLSIFFISPSARSQQFFLEVDSQFEPVQSAIQEGDASQAQAFLDSLTSDHEQSADYHYLQGIIRMLNMQESSRLRMPFIARRMRRDFEQALQHKPDHELAHFALFQWHQLAPGIAGGDKDVMQHHLHQLVDLDSSLQYPARLSLIQSDDEFELSETLYHAWFRAAPENYSARYDYVVRRINTGHFEAALEQLNYALEGLSRTEDQDTLRHALQYQYGKLAAESGAQLEQGETLLRNLLNEEQLPETISRPWAEFRLAQIAAHRGDLSALTAFTESLEESDDERLQDAVYAFQQEHTTG